MKKIIPVAVIAAMLFASCSKQNKSPLVKATGTAGIVVPNGFAWQNSRNVTIDVSVADKLFPASLHVITIYDGDPGAGAKVVSKGSAITKTSFSGKVNLSNQITEVFIVGRFPDGSVKMQKVTVGTADVAVTLGL